jgi:hypothetical protein
MTGDVRKVSAAMIRKSLQGCKRTFDVRLNGLTDEGIEVLCSVLSGELNAELAASAASMPRANGADEIVEACADAAAQDAQVIVTHVGLFQDAAINLLKNPTETNDEEFGLWLAQIEKSALNLPKRIRAIKGKFTLAAQPGQKGED